MAGQKFYAVRNGHDTGIYNNWGDCKGATSGYSGNQFKSFNTLSEAKSYMSGGSSGSSNSSGSGGSGSSYSNYTPSSSSRSSHSSSRSSQSSPSYSSPSYSSPSYSSSSSSGRKSHNVKWSHYSDADLADSSVERVFTDGSSFNNGKSGAKSGYGVYWGENDSRNTSQPVRGGPQTNNHGELLALDHALKQIDNSGDDLSNRKFDVYSDSQYACKSTANYSHNWEKNGWRTAANEPVKHKELIQGINGTVKSIQDKNADLRLKYIPAHSGYEGNEQADRLAKQGARSQ